MPNRERLHLPKHPQLATARTLAPTIEDCRRMLRELRAVGIGMNELEGLTCQDSGAYEACMAHRSRLSYPHRRMLWWVHAVFLHPERLKTARSILTWGRFP